MKKAFDQTVRDLKREVNKKVLKVPGIEQKILDATSNEPWGPHGSHLADIAQATRNYHEYQMIMRVIWKRLNDTGKNWRHVYKALTVLEYLVGHGSERVIDEIREHAYQIQTLSDFQYIDSSGRDQGSNVRRKSQSLVALVNDKERIQEVRQKAAANRDKYRSTYATDGRNSYPGAGGYGDRFDDDRYEGRYRDEDRNGYGRERDWGSRDDERYGRGGDLYNRDGDRYGRDSDERYGRDNYRDDDYRGGRGSDDNQFGPRNKSFDRERDRFSEDDDRYSSRGGRVDEPSQDERRFERKLSEQSPPPSYEAVKDARDNVQDGSGAGNVPPSATKAYSPPVAKASPPASTRQDPKQSVAGISTSASNKEGYEFDEFDPRGSMPDVQTADASRSFISKLHYSVSKGLPHAEPVHAFEKDERELVQAVLQMLQGFSSSVFYWDEYEQRFCLKREIYVSHLSQTSLNGIVNQFTFGGSCLKKVEIFVKKVETSRQQAPTLKAFTNSVKSWLKRLRDFALKEEVKLVGSDSRKSITLLGLTNSMSSLCSGAELMFQVVHGAVPNAYLDSETSLNADEMTVHVLDHLFKKLNEVCLVQGGEEDAYHMLLAIFSESLLPYLEGLDSWLYEGILDDPYEEMFFYSNSMVSIDQPSFWETSYLLRQSRRRKSRSGPPLNPSGTGSTRQVTKDASDPDSISTSSYARGWDQNDMDILVCPVFLKDMARAIISAGKSLQLVRHVQDDCVALYDKGEGGELYDFANHHCKSEVGSDNLHFTKFEDKSATSNTSNRDSISHGHEMNHAREMGVLTLSEVFLLSLVGLAGDTDHIYEYFRVSVLELHQMCIASMGKQNMIKGIGENIQTSPIYNKTWFMFLTNVISDREHIECFSYVQDGESTVKLPMLKRQLENVTSTVSSFCPRNPVISVCREFLQKNKAYCNELNISRNFHLPPLNDENLRKAIFGDTPNEDKIVTDVLNRETPPRLNGTDYTSGFQFDEVKRVRLKNDMRTLETLYPFPTLLPCFQEDIPMSELLPVQKNSTLVSRILNWIQSASLKDTPQPAVIIKECLVTYIKKQVDHIGNHILLKLMNDWRLMDELGVLRAIYLLGSGDLLQQFLTVIYDKMDRGDSWGDDFELNTLLQESIRNSSDGTLLRAPDSLVVSITKIASDDEENTTDNVTNPHKARNQSFGIDAFDMLNFVYKVSWPLDLIANAEALNKYNQVMAFLLKVKRAKLVLDKARRWMWKGRSGKHNYKHHLLLQQKLLHFVDAFHQYVMDRVYHSAWIELCTGMASAGSLDEVIEVHEAYLLSIQRQCFVAPDKLWALIASRIKNILGLALDFYSIEQTLGSGGATPAIRARCEIELDRIEKQFDDCIAFLLRILSFKLNVGHLPHLADLVTRINYNYFYMSDSGNLQTVPRFEATTARVGRTTASKAE